MAKQPGRGQRRGRGTSDASDQPELGEFRSSANVRTGLVMGATFGIKPVQYAVLDGECIFEGDIVLGTEEQVAAQTEQLRAASTGAVAMGVIRTGTQFRWPSCRIPYDIDPSLPNTSRVTDAIAHWESRTQFRFILRTPANASQHPDWVTFRPSSGCSSSVGRQGGQQFVNLASGCTTGNAIHEIGHVVGLWHEQSREDRDSFVTINWSKIQPGLEHNFNQHISDGDDVGAYDYGSIMHYPRNAFSIDGSDTITPVDPTAMIGQRTALSAGDISAANSMCPVVTLKESPADTLKEIRTDTLKEGPFDTIKERIKDIRFDTTKEQIVDTAKEQIKDRIKDVAFDPPFKERDVVLPGRPTINPTPIRPGLGGGGLLPLAVASPHQAPAANAMAGGGDQGSGNADQAAMLDAQLQALADALVQAEAQRNALQAQYDETAELLKQVLDAAENQGGSG